MNIYICHSSKYDYNKKLYLLLKKSSLYKENNIFFPHDTENVIIKTKDIISSYDLVIAEISNPSISQGIELIVLKLKYYVFMKKMLNTAIV